MHYRDPVLTDRARQLRRNMTSAEVRLWSALSGRKLKGAKFCRQTPIDSYIADFMCREHKLIVELDGEGHFESAHDAVRDERLTGLGYTVLRFPNADVMASPRGFEGVLHRIGLHLPDPDERRVPEGRREQKPRSRGSALAHPQPLP